MSRPAVSKGVLVARATRTLPAISRKFLFNPSEITDIHKVEWGTLQVPGASHPIYQFGAGGERLISFDLYLDGDRGRLVSSNSNQSINGSGGYDTDISDEIAFYQSLSYPSTTSAGFNDVSPRICSLTIGKLFNGPVACIVKGEVNVKYKFFKPNMGPVRAILSFTFAEIVIQTVTASSIINAQTSDPGY